MQTPEQKVKLKHCIVDIPFNAVTNKVIMMIVDMPSIVMWYIGIFVFFSSVVVDAHRKNTNHPACLV